MSTLLFGNQFIESLLSSGVVTAEDRVRRIIIDAEVGVPIRLFIERYGDDRLLNVGANVSLEVEGG